MPQIRRNNGSAIDGHTTCHVGYDINQSKRHRTDRVNACTSIWSTMLRAIGRSLAKMKAHYQLAIPGDNLVRLVSPPG